MAAPLAANPGDIHLPAVALGLDSRELGHLISAAMAAPPEVRELRTDSGDIVRIERDLEPGIALRLSASAQPEWEVLVTRVADTRPSRYPAGIPFIAGATAFLGRAAERCVVTWLKTGDLAEFRELMAETTALAGHPHLTALGERLKPLIQRARDGDADARGALRDEAELIRAAMGGDAEQKLRSVWERLQPHPERATALERIFRRVVEATEADGWERVDGDSSETRQPFRMETRTYRRGALERSVMLAVTFGPVSSVMLWEQAAP